MNKRKKVTRRQPLNEKHYEAIALLAEMGSGRGRLTHEQIARKLRISRRTLYRWRQRPDFDKALRNVIERESNTWMRAHKAKNRARVCAGDMRLIERFIMAESRFM
jgi:DNA invertase Pin-like site-specific DNA recombinase